MTRAHNALLDEVEMALDRDRSGISVLTLEAAKIYFEKMQELMQGQIGDREWQLHEALKAKSQM